MDVAELLAGLDVVEHVKAFRAHTLPPTLIDEMINDAWDLDRIAAGYRAFLDRWGIAGPEADGGAVLRISAFTTEYLNYVKPGFRPFLIAAGAVVFALGVITLVQEWRRPQDTGREPSRWTEAADGRGGHAGGRPDGREDGHAGEHGGGHAAGPTGGHAGGYGDGHGHDHSRGPRVAWLMCLPVCAIFLVAPPALGRSRPRGTTSRLRRRPARWPRGTSRCAGTGRSRCRSASSSGAPGAMRSGASPESRCG